MAGPARLDRHPWLPALALALITALAYAGVARAGFVVDDREYIETNSTLESAGGLVRIWTDPDALPHHQYYTVTLTSFWLEHQLWGKNATGYHLVNVALQVLNAVLLWRLLRRLSVPGAWMSAALFAVHPVHVETVAWITERKNVLFVAFYLAAALSYLRFAGVGRDEGTGAREGRWGWYAASLALFALSILSKTIACSLPVVLALLLWMKRERIGRRHALALAPFFVLALGLGFLAAWAESQWVRATGEQWDETFLERTLIAGRALWFYAAKLAWPWPVCFVYERWDVDTGAWWQYAFPVTAVLVPVVLWLARERVGRGPLVAALFFGGAMAPTLGFVNFFFMRYSYVADHLQYLSSAALIALAVAAAARGLERLGPAAERVGAGAGLAVVALFAVLVTRQVPAYESDETLWRDTIAKNPKAWVAHMFLGYELHERGALEEAVQSYERALELADGHPRARVKALLGTTLLALGRTDEAIAALEEAIQVKPTHLGARYQLARALDAKGRVRPAMRHYRAVMRIDPEHAEAASRLAELLVEQGEAPEAAAVLEHLLRLRPGDPEVERRLREARE